MTSSKKCSPKFPVEQGQGGIVRNPRRPTRYCKNSDDEFVVGVLRASGVPLVVIAKALNRPWGLDVKTMKQHYRSELELAEAELLVAAYRRLVIAVEEGDVDAALFLCQRLGRST